MTPLPAAFVQSTRALLGDDAFRRYTAAMESDAVVSIRLNPNKAINSDSAERLTDSRVAWCAEGRYLRERPSFTFDPLFHAGIYYVQEASSMFISHVVRQLFQEAVAVLDLCAAPGGKSTALLSALPEGSVVIANEAVRQRATVLAENMAKWGAPYAVVTHNSASDFGKSGIAFDLMVCDVPCSGEGMFRKDGGAIDEWSEQNVMKCQKLQRQIVSEAWPALKSGGWLVYSTCTYNTLENEDNIEWIARTLGADIIDIAHPDDWGILPSLAGGTPLCRFIPGFTRGEGLTMALLRKHPVTQAPNPLQRTGANTHQRSKAKTATTDAKIAELAKSWIQQPHDMVTMMLGDACYALPSAIHTLWARLSTLRVLHAGIPLAISKGRELLPHPALALSTMLNTDAFAYQELTYHQAIDFLRRQPLVPDASWPRGHLLVGYQHHPLGFVKNLGPRTNNLYPQGWAIKSTHIPEYPPEIIKTAI